ncbi:Uncharacterized protein dnm_008610 [Desulfonema magnum]|uniref:HTH cro/C1-type domain-containing protein n=2 Tax=Desulfonema magnum TaxID=45655 RepID=A0A975BGH1_9BACT|nr:Uncharacterized protein dnm_008610 [Desulfonema magnum]
MAVAIGLNQANIRDLELGKVKISTLHALAMQNIFDLSPDWLLTGKGKMLCEDHKKTKNVSPALVRALQSHPGIGKIVLMLEQMGDDDIKNIQSRAEERLKIKKMEERLRKMEKKIRETS